MAVTWRPLYGDTAPASSRPPTTTTCASASPSTTSRCTFPPPSMVPTSKTVRFFFSFLFSLLWSRSLFAYFVLLCARSPSVCYASKFKAKIEMWIVGFWFIRFNQLKCDQVWFFFLGKVFCRQLRLISCTDPAGLLLSGLLCWTWTLEWNRTDDGGFAQWKHIQ